TITYRWRAEDACGNFTEVTQSFDVLPDTAAPTNISCPTGGDLGCNPLPSQYAPGTATWEDDCSNINSGVFEGTPIQDGCDWSVTHTYWATDDCGNMSTCEQTFTWSIDEYESCETAFGRLSTNNPPSQCFLDDNDYNFNRWGWTNYIEQEGSYTMELWAGAAHCDTSNGEFVGTATVTYNGGLVDVEYQLIGDYVMSEAHIYIGCDKYPTKRNGRPTVAPGQYNFNLGELDYVQNYSLEDVEVSGPFWIIVHAVTCTRVCACTVSNDEGGSQVSNENPIDCSAEFDPITEIGTEGTEMEWNLDFTTYPVPFDNYLNVSYNLDYDSDITIEVFDIRGRLIQSIQSDYTQGTRAVTRLDLGGTQNEVLFIKVTTDRGIGMKKVVANNYIKD
ncbi:T9SS type A sorting domain-containing protein, partial [Aureitalea sp. L0-47]|uniref:T9SS type A sorting domain-containing protein n=1 Tax=Aureitalea sp. L0-47 TaxID=2816962 RepID=UPI002238AD6C